MPTGTGLPPGRKVAETRAPWPRPVAKSRTRESSLPIQAVASSATFMPRRASARLRACRR